MRNHYFIIWNNHMDNIQVLERAFGLLEAVAEDSSRPHTLSELVESRV
jgi:hypothetical protein